MKRLRITPSVIPNLFTAMNMFCGLLSIIYAAESNFTYAAGLIIIASIFDALDGFMARLTNSCSEIGIELDSLSDVISFGAAPSFLIYSIHLKGLESFGIIISSLLMIAGGFRLARFNVQLVGFDKAYFKGLPIPSQAIMMASFLLAFTDNGSIPENVAVFVIPLVLILAYLMVSNIKYDTLPKFTKEGLKEKPALIIITLISIVLIFVFSLKLAFFYFFILYILFGIIRHIIHLFNKIFKKDK